MANWLPRRSTCAHEDSFWRCWRKRDYTSARRNHGALARPSGRAWIIEKRGEDRQTPMEIDFELFGEIIDAETIAFGPSIRELPQLRNRFGRGRWRKRKGV